MQSCFLINVRVPELLALVQAMHAARLPGRWQAVPRPRLRPHTRLHPRLRDLPCSDRWLCVCNLTFALYVQVKHERFRVFDLATHLAHGLVTYVCTF